MSTGCSTCRTRTSVFSCRIPITTARSRSSANPESSTANRTLMASLSSRTVSRTTMRQCATFAVSFAESSAEGRLFRPRQMLRHSVVSIERPTSGMSVTIAHERGPLSPRRDSGCRFCEKVDALHRSCRSERRLCFACEKHWALNTNFRPTEHESWKTVLHLSPARQRPCCPIGLRLRPD